MAVGGHDVACFPLTCAQAQTGRRPGASNQDSERGRYQLRSPSN